MAQCVSYRESVPIWKGFFFFNELQTRQDAETELSWISVSWH